MSKPVCRILIVEDVVELLELLANVLERGGYTFLMAKDAAEARQIIDGDDSPNLILSDVVLPGGEDGFSLGAFARSRGIPSIFLTGNHSLHDRLEASGFAYLLKPFRISALTKAIEHVLRVEDKDCVVPDATGEKHFAADKPSARRASRNHPKRRRRAVRTAK